MAVDLNAPVTWVGTKELVLRAWRWWSGEIAALLPARWRQPTSRTHSGPELTLSEDGSTWIARNFSKTFDGPLVARPDLLAALAGACRSRLASIVLPKPSVLTTSLPLPPSSERKLKEIARLQIERLSPLPFDETAWGAALKTPASNQAIIAMARRTEVTEVVDAVRSAGFSAFEVVDPSYRVQLYIEDAAARARSRLLGALWLVAVLVIAGSLFVSWQRSSEMKANLRAEIAMLKPKAEEVAAIRREVLASNEIMATLDRIARSPGPLSVWAAVTDALPSTAWLTAMEITGDQIRLEGYAQTSAEVLTRFANASTFADPRFDGTLQRQPELDADRFVLRATVRSGATP